jgi:hypothetical protein
VKVAIYASGILGTFGLALFGAFFSNHRTLANWTLFASIVIYALGLALYWQTQISLDEARRATAATATAPKASSSGAPVPPTPTAQASKAKASQPKPMTPLVSMSEGQRALLKKKVDVHGGNTVRLVLVGADPQTALAFELLIDVFEEGGWAVQRSQVGLAVVVGASFPDGPYLTGTNMASPLLETVFRIFSSVAISLPLAPNAYAGPLSMGTPPDVVIVVH